MGPVVPKHVVSSQTREQIHLPCIPRGILNQQTSREARTCNFCSSTYPAGDLNLIILYGLSPLLFQPMELTSCSGLAHGTRTKPINTSTILATETGSGMCPNKSPWKPVGYFGIAGSKFCSTTTEARSYGGHLMDGGPKNEDKRRRAEL